MLLALAASLALLCGATVWQVVAHRGGGPGGGGPASGVATLPPSTPSATAPATPSPTASAPSPLPQGVVLNVDMMTARVGWGRSLDGGVIHTTQGVLHWTSVTPPADPASIAAAAFVDADHAAVLVQLGPAAHTGTEPAVVFRTADGGRSWTRGATFDGGGAWEQLSFLDRLHGWALVHLGAAAGSEGVAVWRTVDGGAHFTRMSLTGGDSSTPGALPFGCDKAGLVFVTASDGWAAGTCNGGPPFLYATHDGGRTWARVPVPAPAGTSLDNCGCWMSVPQFTSGSHGVAYISGNSASTGAQIRATLYDTDNGGVTWTMRAAPAGNMFVDAIDDSNLVLLDIAGDGSVTLLRSHDGGATWQRFPVPTRLATRVDFVTPLLGWAFGTTASDALTGPPLLQTTDGGASWTPITPVVVVPGG